MKTSLAALLLVGFLAASQAATTIDSVNRYAYGGNIGGWIGWPAPTRWTTS